MYVQASVGRKHSSQNMRGGNRTRAHFRHVRAMRRPFCSSSRNRDIASPADHAYFASGWNRVCVTLPSWRSRSEERRVGKECVAGGWGEGGMKREEGGG